jgi:hypothetical protein
MLKYFQSFPESTWFIFTSNLIYIFQWAEIIMGYAQSANSTI